jgi:hypothetical protein
MTTSNGGIRREPYLPYAPTLGHSGDHSVTADNQTLMRQGPMTANEYLMSAIGHIDNELGEGYAAKHPELIAAFMQTSALDYGAGVIARAIEGVSGAIESLYQAIENAGA